MKKETGVCLLLLLLLAACKNNDHSVQFRTLDEGLKRYGDAARGNIDLIDNELKEKLQDPRVYNAKIWQPRAAYIKAAADSMTGYIDSLREALKKEAGMTRGGAEANGDNRDAVESLFEKQGGAAALYRRLMDFNERVVSALNGHEFDNNPTDKAELEKFQQKTRKAFPVQQESQVTDCFKNIHTTGALVMLDKIRNDVAITTNELMTYCNKITRRYWDHFEGYAALATLNTSCLKAGGLLEISAGMGAFTVALDPRISIDGKPIELDPKGVAIYRTHVGEKPGKYSIPVKISFTKPDSVEETYLKQVSYTVEK
jgi:hypothetical protein